MSWLWVNFLSFICYPIMSADKYTSIHDYYFQRYVVRKRKRRMKRMSRIARKNML